MTRCEEMARVGSQSTLLRRAYRLYVGYKTTTSEYRQIADEMGLTIGQLNSRLWVKHTARYRRWTAAAGISASQAGV